MKILNRLSIVSVVLVSACICVPASTAVAQNKVSAVIDCDKADPMHSIPIPDRQGYFLVISQHRCTYTKPIALEGLEAKEFVNAVFNEVMGASIRTTASGVTTYSNGDKGYTRSTGTGDAKSMTRSGKWTFSGGTGKLREIKGGGTYTCKMKSSEGAYWAVRSRCPCPRDPSHGFCDDLRGHIGWWCLQDNKRRG